MNYTVGFRKEDGSVGIALLNGWEGDYQSAAQYVKEQTGTKVALVLVKG